MHTFFMNETTLFGIGPRLCRWAEGEESILSTRLLTISRVLVIVSLYLQISHWNSVLNKHGLRKRLRFCLCSIRQSLFSSEQRFSRLTWSRDQLSSRILMYSQRCVAFALIVDIIWLEISIAAIGDSDEQQVRDVVRNAENHNRRRVVSIPFDSNGISDRLVVNLFFGILIMIFDDRYVNEFFH